ncbi:uncharacterized protein [Oryza sativa Japonica Group]
MPKPNHHASATSASTASGNPMDSTVSYQGGLGHKSKTKIKKGKEKGSSTVPAVYDVNADIEEEYRLFLENVRVHENEDFVLEYDGKVIRYGGEEMDDDDSCIEVSMKEKEEVLKALVISSDDESPTSLRRVYENDSSRQKVEMVVDDQEKMNEKNEVALRLKGKGGPIEDVEKQSHGIIWPTHINDRKESNFKIGLVEALSKPFCQGEYDRLYGMASTREPLKKERRTRSGSKTYYSSHSMGKSYFDCYPDLAEQVEETSYPNRLALLRGLFYWLENVGKKHQFMPWRNEHKRFKYVNLL